MPTMRRPALALVATIAIGASMASGLTAVAQSPSPQPSPAVSTAPVASPQRDPDLESRMPRTIGGQQLTIDSRTGSAIFEGAEPAAIQPLVDGLTALGKTLADLSVGVAHNDDYSVAITVLRVPGVDAAGLIAPVLGLASPEEQIQQVPGTIAGKAVTAVTDSSGVQQFYVAGDTLWIIRATDPALTEILTALP